MSFRNLLVSRCDIEVETESKDAKGHVTVTWAKAVSNMRCRFNPLRGTETIKYEAAGRETTHRMYCETRLTGAAAISASTAPTFSPKTVPDLIKGLQSAHRSRHRIVATLAGTKRYFQIETPFDTDEVQKVCVIDLVERDSAYFNA